MCRIPIAGNAASSETLAVLLCAAACLPACLATSCPAAGVRCRSTRLLENEIRVLRDESNRLTHEKAGLAERIKENHEKIKLNNQVRLGWVHTCMSWVPRVWMVKSAGILLYGSAGS